MTLGDDAHSMAAMSCCPGGAVTMLGIGLGQMAGWAARRLTCRRTRRREIAMLDAMWDVEYTGPRTRLL